MKRTALCLIVASLLILPLASCYTYKIEYGDGPQDYVEVEKIKNHYFLFGLVPGNNPDPLEVAEEKGQENYEVKVQHTFLDGFLGFITFGIYSPTTTTIKK